MKSIRHAAAPKNSTRNTRFGILGRNKRSFENSIVPARHCRVKKTTKLWIGEKWRCIVRCIKSAPIPNRKRKLQAEPFNRFWYNVLNIYLSEPFLIPVAKIHNVWTNVLLAIQIQETGAYEKNVKNLDKIMSRMIIISRKLCDFSILYIFIAYRLYRSDSHRKIK